MTGRISTSERPFQVGDDQAQEGRHRRQARQAVRQADQEHRGSARTGGGDPDGNPTLYDAIQKARKNSVPVDNIDRAVKRGSGAESGGADWQTIMYEGYGPSGVAILVECLTDNRNRAATEVRVAMSRNGGSMADPGSVSYLFSRKGVVLVPKNEPVRGRVPTAVLDAGAEEVNDLGDSFEVVSPRRPTSSQVRTSLQDAGIDYDSADSSFLPSVQVPLDEEGARRCSAWSRRSRTPTTSRTSTRTSTSATRCSRPSARSRGLKVALAPPVGLPPPPPPPPPP